MRETVGAKSFKVVTLVLLTLFTVVPLYVMITTAIKPLGDVQKDHTDLGPDDVHAEDGPGARLLPDSLRRPHPTRRGSST